MGKEIVFDYSKTAGFISEEEMKNMKSIVMGAKDVLTAKSGAGNDYLGWIDLPVDYDKEEFARIKKSADLTSEPALRSSFYPTASTMCCRREREKLLRSIS